MTITTVTWYFQKSHLLTVFPCAVTIRLPAIQTVGPSTWLYIMVMVAMMWLAWMPSSPVSTLYLPCHDLHNPVFWWWAPQSPQSWAPMPSASGGQVCASWAPRWAARRWCARCRWGRRQACCSTRLKHVDSCGLDVFHQSRPCLYTWLLFVMLIIKELLPEVATASRLNLRLIEARATLGSRVVSSSPLEWFLLQSFVCLFVISIIMVCHGKHPLSQMPQSDPRDNSLSSCDCDPASRLQRELSLFSLERALSLFQAVKSRCYDERPTKLQPDM